MTEKAHINTVLTKSLSTLFSADRTVKSQSEEGDKMKGSLLGSLQGGL